MPKTVLLADDSVTIQKVVGITFANEDLELVTVDNGTDALARARQIVPDLVLADIGMPGMNGYDLCAAIRRTPQLAHIPVLLLTGTFESYDEARARTAGANGHISKPFEAQALVDRVWELLNGVEAPARQAPASRKDFEAFQDESGSALDGDSGSQLPDLPNSSFGTTQPERRPQGRLPAPDASDLHDMGDSRSRTRVAPPVPFGAFEDFSGRGEDTVNNQTAFIDPLQDLTPPLRTRTPERSGPLLPPAEPPDLLDLSGFDPQGDTNPTYADGSTIGGEMIGPDDSRVASGESIALVLPDIPELPSAPQPGSVAKRPPAPPVKARPVEDADPLDAEPFESPESAAREPESSPAPETWSTPAPPPPVPASAVPPAVPAPAAGGSGSLDRDALHATVEKLAWEAFGSLSQELVEQFTRRAEAILWEIVPAVAERLVREEIERLKGEP